MKQLNAEIVPASDTAGSVRMIKEEGRLDYAAVASAKAAELYGMKIIAKEIEDNPHNFTRFFVLSKEDSPPTGNDKTSIVFSLKHKPGALYDCLGEFATRNINLSKLETRPTRHQPWEYNFYMDFAGHREEKEVAEALKALEEHAVFVKILGSYPKATVSEAKSLKLVYEDEYGAYSGVRPEFLKQFLPREINPNFEVYDSLDGRNRFIASKCSRIPGDEDLRQEDSVLIS